eukprot:2565405-Prymnesium_polylepis.1
MSDDFTPRCASLSASVGPSSSSELSTITFADIRELRVRGSGAVWDVAEDCERAEPTGPWLKGGTFSSATKGAHRKDLNQKRQRQDPV